MLSSFQYFSLFCFVCGPIFSPNLQVRGTWEVNFIMDFIGHWITYSILLFLNVLVSLTVSLYIAAHSKKSVVELTLTEFILLTEELH